MKIQLERLSIAVEEQEIAASLLAPTSAVPGVLFVHGWGGSQDEDLERAREVAGLGCICMTFDLRGHSKTTNQRKTVTRKDNLNDLIATYDQFISQPHVENSAIAVVGSSYGAYLATILTSWRPVRWLALRAPAIYKDEGWEVPKRDLHLDADLLAYRRRSIQWEQNRALRACKAFKGDVLIVESEHDDLIPHAVVVNHIAALTQARSITFRTLADADHSLSRTVDQKAYTTVLKSWLTEMVIGARSDAVAPEVPGTGPDVESRAA